MRANWTIIALAACLIGAGSSQALGQAPSTQPANALRGNVGIRIAAPATQRVVRQAAVIAGPIQLAGGPMDGAAESEGFTVHKGDPSAAETLAAFDEAAKKGAWDKAFVELEKVMSSPADTMVRRPDGFYLFAKAHVQRMLVALPPAGRQAYRLFNDAAARKALAQVDAPSEAEPAGNPVSRLQELFDRYFITSVGDQIADRLGDAKFESGDFGGAAHCWDMIRSDYPDTSLSMPRILAKRAIALARAGQGDELEIARAQLREKYPDQSVRFGGRDLSIADLVNQLPHPAIDSASAQSATTDTDQRNLLPTTGSTPDWQMVFLDAIGQEQIRRLSTLRSPTGVGYSANAIVPGATASKDRIYLNWLGVGIAIDANTGKLLWRRESFNTIATRIQQMVLSGYDSGETSIEVMPSGDKLLLEHGSALQRTISVPAAQMGMVAAGRVLGNVNYPVRPGTGVLTCLTTDGGQLWSSQTSIDLDTWNIMGHPLIGDDLAYVVATPAVARNTEVNLLAVSLATGNIAWKLPLGSVGMGANFRGMFLPPRPLLKRQGDTLYVLTGNGALLAINLPGRRIDWVFTYESSQASGRAANLYYPEDAQSASSLQLSGSTLLFKEKGSAMVYAIDAATTSLKWKRRIDSDNAIIASDATAFYVLGDDLSGIDWSERQMLWSTKTPLGSRQFQPLIAGSRVYVLGTEGVYAIDLQSGRRETFRIADHSGGKLLRVGDRLICVSNRSVTAYPLVLR